MKRFIQKNVLITGGGTGIGFETAKSFLQEGAGVVLVSRNREHLEKAKHELSSLGKVETITGNVREPDSVKSFISEAFQKMGYIDVLINNAGANFLAPASQVSPNGFKSIIETVLNGTFYCSRFIFDFWAESNRGGNIISIAATNGTTSSPFMLASGAAKAGIINMTKTLAVEWAQFHIRVNSISPGPVKTEGANKRLWADPNMQEQISKEIPLGYMATPEDLVPVILFLASDESRYITGADIIVDGGEMLRGLPDWLGKI